jgi:hypothetical protein
MSTTAIPAEIVPEQIEVPRPDAVAVAATDLTRRDGKGDTAVNDPQGRQGEGDGDHGQDEGGSEAALVGLRR